MEHGLGFTRSFWASALLVAMRSGRVLLEVAVNSSWPHPPRPRSDETPSAANVTRVQRKAAVPRWCSVAPFTLQCFYTPWSHCALPPEHTHRPLPLHGKRYRLAHLVMETPSLRLKLSAMKAGPLGWALWGSRSATSVATRFLFAPRPYAIRIETKAVGMQC